MKKVANTTKDPQPQWVMGGNPDAILWQEEQGRNQLIKSDQLPSEVNDPRGIDAATQYAAMGMKGISPTPGDELFLFVQLPDGWKKEATEHSMWNKLIDDKGRLRANFFYKAAFYDRKAHINFISRYLITEDYFMEEKNPELDWDNARQFRIYDTTNGETILLSEKYFHNDQDKQRKKLTALMDEKYPDWKNINAYWD